MKNSKKLISLILCIGLICSMMVFATSVSAVETDKVSTGDFTVDSGYVYMLNTNNWSTPTVYAWSTAGNIGAWPGVSMSQVGTYNGTAVYGASVASTMTSCIFSNSGSSQTADLTITRNKAYNPSTKSWVEISGGTTTPTQATQPTQGTTSTTPSTDDFGTSVNADKFSWDNASVYFLLTDRFYNGKTSNDHSYNRLLEQNGSVTTKSSTDAGSFQGGDFVGIEQKITEGYFDNLGVNALWISAPYEQIQGYVCSGSSRSAFPVYAYHGYYAGDYSEFDDNFGTPAEFQSMIDTAHKHGIRIVLDIVMNHPGYNTIYDMAKFGFGYFRSSDWQTRYYQFSGNNTTYHSNIVYSDSGNSAVQQSWGSWWGGSWLRAGINGYDPLGNSELTQSAGGDLPDFKTESQSSVSVPQFLQTKWSQEGTSAQKTSELNSYFSSTGKSKTVRNYLVYWLSQYVKNYGVDGFRCDTAKHVEKESWAALKTECVSALKTWRANNPSKPGADWTEDFWTTGENYGMGLSSANDSYYTQGKFDSMINFSFTGGGGVPSSGSINGTYATYASNINNSSNYNVLTYISSHDTKLAGRDQGGTHNQATLMYQGSAFQLMPGGIQIFYGDESGREYVTNSDSALMTYMRSGNHDVRSFMNWSSTDKNLLAHWQKVGSFRNNHIAVGAGSHTALSSTSGVAFERYYNTTTVKDKVMACIAASANTNVTITVKSSHFADGTVMRNTYDGTTATVSGGKVTFNSGANGTILMEVASSARTITNTLTNVTTNNTATQVNDGASYSATLTAASGYNLDTVTVTMGGKDITSTSYSNGKITIASVTGNVVITASAKVIPTTASTAPTTASTAPTTASTAPTTASTAPTTASTAPTTASTAPTVASSSSQATTPSTNPTESSSSTVPVTSLIIGDTNLDKTVNIKDVSMIQQYKALIATLTADQIKSGDANSDGSTNVKDATIIQKYLANIDTGYAVGKPVGTPSSEPTSASTAPTTASTAPTTASTAPTTASTAPTTASTAPTTASTAPTTASTAPPTQPTTQGGLLQSGYVYMYNTANWATVNVHYWNATGGSVWPGDPMTKVGTVNGHDVYGVALSPEFTSVIFNNGSGTQTANLTYEPMKMYDNTTRKWVDANGDAPVTEPTTIPSGYTLIKLVDTTEQKWMGDGSAVLVMVDSATSTEYEMTPGMVGEWTVAVPSSATSFTINRNDPETGATWNSWTTGDRGSNNVFSANASSGGTWSTQVISSSSANPFVDIVVGACSPILALLNFIF